MLAAYLLLSTYAAVGPYGCSSTGLSFQVCNSLSAAQQDDPYALTSVALAR